MLRWEDCELDGHKGAGEAFVLRRILSPVIFNSFVKETTGQTFPMNPQPLFLNISPLSRLFGPYMSVADTPVRSTTTDFDVPKGGGGGQ